MAEYSDIEDSIRLEEVLDELGIRVNYVTRGEHWASCPLPSHPGNDASPSFSVNDSNLLWNCFTCSEGGKLPMLVAAMEGFENIKLDGEIIRSAWDQGVEWLLPFSDGEPTTDEGFMRQIEALLQAPVRRPITPRRPTLPYMSDRGFRDLHTPPTALLKPWHLTATTAEAFGVKYAPERRRIKGGEEHIGPAIIIPHYFRGELVGWQERWLGDRPDWLPKYTNTDDFPKALTLWGYDSALKMQQPVVVVESAMTAMRLGQSRYPAVGTFGTGISDQQIRLLRGFVHGVWIALDNDPDYINAKGKLVRGAGYKARDMLIEQLCDYVPLEIVSSVPKEKGDLADLPDDDLHAIMAKRKTAFLLRANPKK